VKHEINTTVDVVPVINVALVITLTLMIISPHLNPDEMPVDLPEARTAEVKDRDKVEVVFTRDGRIAVDGLEVTEAELPAVLSSTFENYPRRSAVVKADRNLRYGDVERVIAHIEGAGAPRIALATDQKKPEQG